MPFKAILHTAWLKWDLAGRFLPVFTALSTGHVTNQQKRVPLVAFSENLYI